VEGPHLPQGKGCTVTGAVALLIQGGGLFIMEDTMSSEIHSIEIRELDTGTVRIKFNNDKSAVYHVPAAIGQQLMDSFAKQTIDELLKHGSRLDFFFYR
jgi:hypothetical protein